MIKRSFVLIATMTFVGLSGCLSVEVPRSTPEEIKAALEEQAEYTINLFLDRLARVNELAYPILVANHEICGDIAGDDIGLSLVTKGMLPEDWRAQAESSFGVDDHPYVVHVASGSPAANAGIKRGDKIVQINDTVIRTGWFSRKHGINTLKRELRSNSTVELKILRGSDQLELSIQSEPMCTSRVFVVQANEFNAYADSRDIFLFSGLVKDLEDIQIQAVIAHELAHNTEQHVQKGLGHRVAGMLLDFVLTLEGVKTAGAGGDIASVTFSPAMEREADYISMYMLARAGLDTDELANIWLEIAAEEQEIRKNNFLSTHPFEAERFSLLKTTQKEIAAKIQANEPLVPERK